MSRFVTIDNERGYWISNGLDDLWLMLLALHIQPRLEWYAIESRMASQWIFGSKFNVTGSTWDHYDKFLAEPGGREVLGEALERLNEAVSKLPETVSPDTFRLMGFGYEIGPFPRVHLTAMCAAFSDLLDGRITARAGDKVDTFGQYVSRCGAT